MTASFRLDGRHAVVAGASGGIGAATALAFASAGAATLTLVARTRAALEDVAAAARRLGADVRVAPCDVTDEAAVDATFGGIDALDVLVYAAGANVPQALDEVELDTADRLWALNVRGALHCTREAVRRMPSSGGAIVLVSSQMGQVGAPREERLLRDQARRGGPHSRARGRAGAARRARRLDRPDVRRHRDDGAVPRRPPVSRATCCERIPLGRLATVEEVAAAALFAASPAAGSTTGCSLLVDGGWTAQ